MPISYPSGSFDSWPGFLVCPSPNRNSFPLHESMKPHIWSFESFHLLLISVFLLFHVFQHFRAKVGARDWYTNFTKLSEFPYKSFFGFRKMDFTCLDYSCFFQIGRSQGHSFYLTFFFHFSVFFCKPTKDSFLVRRLRSIITFPPTRCVFVFFTNFQLRFNSRRCCLSSISLSPSFLKCKNGQKFQVDTPTAPWILQAKRK